ncbi:MAG: HigA family addiction module antitoxin [Bryobacteraceae bacterium]|jgi:addiction module HigA family antidote
MERKNGLPPVHPGEIIKQDILPAVGLSVTAVAKALGVSRQMLHDILAERRPLSAVMCLKLSRLFGGSPEVWMRLQAAYDLKKAQQDKKVMERVARIVPVKAVEEARGLNADTPSSGRLLTHVQRDARRRESHGLRP